jgi:hypothetical protein
MRGQRKTNAALNRLDARQLHFVVKATAAEAIGVATCNKDAVRTHMRSERKVYVSYLSSLLTVRITAVDRAIRTVKQHSDVAVRTHRQSKIDPGN